MWFLGPILALIFPASFSLAYEPITPDKLRELVEKSFDVQAAKSKVIERRAGVIRSFDPYIPDISFSAESYAFAESYRQNRSPVYLNASISLFDKGRDIFGIQKARSDLRISEQGLAADRKDALIIAYDIYFQIVEAKENLRVLSELKKELSLVLDRARAMVAVKALARMQLTRLDVEDTLIDNRIESTRAQVIALKNRLIAELQLDPDADWEVSSPQNSTIPKNYLKVTAEDLSIASGEWNRALELAEKTYNLDSPSRWLAFSEQLPKVDLTASAGRPDFNSIRNEFSIRASIEIPLPVLDIPIMFKPINTLVGQAVRQNEIRRAEVLAELRANIEARTARLNAALVQLKRIESPLNEARSARAQERQEILAAGGQAFNYLMYLAQIRDLELALNAAQRSKETEYRALQILRGDHLQR